MAAAPAFGQGTVRRVGFLSLVANELEVETGRAFRTRLQQLGHVEGRNLILEHRSAQGRQDQLPALAEQLLQSKPDVLVSGLGTLPALALKKAAPATVPIVFCAVGDPVAAGLVASLSKPGGNITGVSTQVPEVAAKRLQLARELMPELKRVAVLMNPDTPSTRQSRDEILRAAPGQGIEVAVAEFRNAAELESAFARVVAARPGVLVVLEEPLMITLRAEIARRALEAKLPTIAGVKEAVEAGALVSYGVSRAAAFGRAAEFVDRFLRGAPPGSLPVEQVAQFDLAINTNTARAIGVQLPAGWLVSAGTVVGR